MPIFASGLASSRTQRSNQAALASRLRLATGSCQHLSCAHRYLERPGVIAGLQIRSQHTAIAELMEGGSAMRGIVHCDSALSADLDRTLQATRDAGRFSATSRSRKVPPFAALW